jgi:hypothetical protein
MFEWGVGTSACGPSTGERHVQQACVHRGDGRKRYRFGGVGRRRHQSGRFGPDLRHDPQLRRARAGHRTGALDLLAGRLRHRHRWGGIFGPWLGDGNSFFGNFGVFITFDNDVTAFSAQVWDPSGPPSPIGGGLIVAVWNDGVEVTSTVIEPAWGTDVGSWLDIVGDGGTAFDEVRFVGLGFDPSTFTDNLSWTPVPAPGAIALLGLAGLAGRRRRD